MQYPGLQVSADMLPTDAGGSTDYLFRSKDTCQVWIAVIRDFKKVIAPQPSEEWYKWGGLDFPLSTVISVTNDNTVDNCEVAIWSKNKSHTVEYGTSDERQRSVHSPVSTYMRQ